jgi:hypothetical protein
MQLSRQAGLQVLAARVAASRELHQSAIGASGVLFAVGAQLLDRLVDLGWAGW